MKGDFERLTFQSGKHYRLVMRQQGRVDVAADWNEQQQILRHYGETEAADVIGPAGVPMEVKPDGTLVDSGGFLIAVKGSDLTVGRGRIYVNGILCENEATDVTLLKQPDLPAFLHGVQSSALASGSHVAYLDVWLRHLTALDDSSIREKALGGPDHDSRAKVVWQVKLADGDTCEGFTPPPAPTGTLAARTGPVDPGDDPCVLPPTAGYRRLQNQFYRVEIHQGGSEAPTFKWSRDNGSVVTSITSADNTGLVKVADIGRDDYLGFRAGQWVEFVDDSYELNGLPGPLFRIAKPPLDSNTLQLDLAGGAFPKIDLTLHPKLRRWDQVSIGGGTDISNGVRTTPTTTDGWIPLEDGLQVQFGVAVPGSAPLTYRTGDYWQIAARTAIDADTGNIEWPVDGAIPRPLLPMGIEHAYCPLAVVTRSGDFFKVISDCRKLFPPLTALNQEDCCCAVTIAPGPTWDVELQSAIAKAPAGDVSVCFRAGNYLVEKRLQLAGSGNLHITGAGPGTRIIAANFEAAMTFTGFASVSVSALYAEAGRTGTKSSNMKGLVGALTFLSCGSVEVDSTGLRCAPGMGKAATCITVNSAPPVQAPVNTPNVRAPSRRANAAVRVSPAGGAASVRIRHCDLVVGARQVGILVVDSQRTQIEDNTIAISDRRLMALANLLQQFKLRGTFRKLLIAQAHIKSVKAVPLPALAANNPTAAVPPEQKSPFNAKVTDGATEVNFVTPPTLTKLWQELIDRDMRRATWPTPLIRRLKRVADRVLTDVTYRPKGSAFGDWYDETSRLYNFTAGVASQGIVVAGRIAGDVRIHDNTISGVAQGIHVGLSHNEEGANDVEPKKQHGLRSTDPNLLDRIHNTVTDIATYVSIRNNTLDISIPLAARGREGIFVGNVTQLTVSDNFVTFSSLLLGSFRKQGQLAAAGGIRIFGLLGPMLIVRQNYVHGFRSGILVHPLLTGADFMNPTAPIKFKYQWLVADNRVDGGTCAAEGQWMQQVQFLNNSLP